MWAWMHARVCVSMCHVLFVVVCEVIYLCTACTCGCVDASMSIFASVHLSS